jgi:preprotein translocase subunit SecG
MASAAVVVCLWYRNVVHGLILWNLVLLQKGGGIGGIVLFTLSDNVACGFGVLKCMQRVYATNVLLLI